MRSIQEPAMRDVVPVPHRLRERATIRVARMPAVSYGSGSPRVIGGRCYRTDHRPDLR
jgi:hypothetical protein